jgi:hypothetical protein
MCVCVCVCVWASTAVVISRYGQASMTVVVAASSGTPPALPLRVPVRRRNAQCHSALVGASIQHRPQS